MAHIKRDEVAVQREWRGQKGSASTVQRGDRH